MSHLSHLINRLDAQQWCYLQHRRDGHHYDVDFERRDGERVLLVRAAQMSSSSNSSRREGFSMVRVETVENHYLLFLKQMQPPPALLPLGAVAAPAKSRPRVRLVVDPPPDRAPLGLAAFRRCDLGAAYGAATARSRPLQVSGSSQFNRNGLHTLVQLVPQSRLTVVDLRQESHGFVGAEAICWWVGDNEGNAGAGVRAVRADESARLQQLNVRGAGTQAAYRRHHGHFEPAQLPAAVAASEAQICDEAQIGYLRLPMTDREARPSDATIEAFVRHVRDLGPKAWLHFHCLHGHGRTTLFMAMADLMHNAHCMSLDEVVDRQWRLGGVDLRRRSATTHHFLRQFKRFCVDSHDSGRAEPPTWSAWLRREASMWGWLRGALGCSGLFGL